MGAIRADGKEDGVRLEKPPQPQRGPRYFKAAMGEDAMTKYDRTAQIDYEEHERAMGHREVPPPPPDLHQQVCIALREPWERETTDETQAS